MSINIYAKQQFATNVLSLFFIFLFVAFYFCGKTDCIDKKNRQKYIYGTGHNVMVSRATINWLP